MEAAEQLQEENRASVPEYLPARMLNEYVYCPRLFFYEWVIGVFQENADTLEGKSQHKRVDAVASPLPSADELDDTMRSRSVSMSSDRYG